MQIVEVEEPLGLDQYEAFAHMLPAVRDLRSDAQRLVPLIGDRTLWVVNSTAQGGGVAEMLPKLVSLLRELGVDTRWIVIESHRPEFFVLTKRLHNLIHGVGDPHLTAADRQLYEEVNRENAEELAAMVRPQDMVVIHDPQPLAAGAMLRQRAVGTAIWRCHIGLDRSTPETEAAWTFLKDYALTYDHAVFSAPEYIPSFLSARSSVIHPGIDPLSHKNRDLSPHKLQGILCNAGLAIEHAPVLTPPFEPQALRLASDGEWRPPNQGEEMGLLFRPIIAQVSRWDRLKGFEPVLHAFVRLKRLERSGASPLHARRLEICRLVLAGPDPHLVEDDPEGQQVVREIATHYLSLAPEVQRDIAVLLLPMTSRKENALMVNAIQRCATVAVQNSIEEGFGLTVAEAMWKRVPVVGSSATGIRHQIRDGIDGVLVRDPNNPDEIAAALDALLSDAAQRGVLGASAQRQVHDRFLIFSKLRAWLALLAEMASRER